MNDEDKKLLELPRFEVRSKNFKSIGYCYQTRTLIIEFKPLVKYQTPPVYKYKDVSPELFDALYIAPSFDIFLNEKFRDYSYDKLL
jgi:hypothetical protein